MVSLVDDDFAQFSMNPRGQALIVKTYDPSGKPFRGATLGPAEDKLMLVAEVPGTYRVEVAGKDGRASGTYTIALEKVVTLDGAIVCLDGDGKPQFRDWLFRRGEPRFIAFDLLWLDGTDLRFLPLTDRKQELRRLIPRASQQLLYCDHVESDGEGLFRLACENDLEGIVAKEKFAPYQPETQWLNIRNRSYSQWAGREELFERERGGDPNLEVWAGCVRAFALNSSELTNTVR